ncbi:hypothetical protein K440DRAFT_624827 [Wilcoxina mikolae CBS 423.85]|nr:hypothetical protein K440DRAFT_624827 [Wilcoxina mikolae CBS 423.85]
MSTPSITLSSLGREELKGSDAPPRFDEDQDMAQAFGTQQIARLEYLDHIEGLAPQQQTLALAGAVFDLDVEIRDVKKDMKKEIKKLERRIDKRMDRLESLMEDVITEVKKMTRRRVEMLAGDPDYD